MKITNVKLDLTKLNLWEVKGSLKFDFSLTFFDVIVQFESLITFFSFFI